MLDLLAAPVSPQRDSITGTNRPAGSQAAKSRLEKRHEFAGILRLAGARGITVGGRNAVRTGRAEQGLSIRNFANRTAVADSPWEDSRLMAKPARMDPRRPCYDITLNYTTHSVPAVVPEVQVGPR